MTQDELLREFKINAKGNFFARGKGITIFKSRSYDHKGKWRIMYKGTVGQVFYDTPDKAIAVILDNAAYFGIN